MENNIDKNENVLENEGVSFVENLTDEEKDKLRTIPAEGTVNKVSEKEEENGI